MADFLQLIHVNLQISGSKKGPGNLTPNLKKLQKQNVECSYIVSRGNKRVVLYLANVP